MITVTLQYGDNYVNVEFPCGDNHLLSRLSELHYEGNELRYAFLHEVIEPKELAMLEKTFVNPDELNYLAKRMDSFWGDEEIQFFEAAKHRGCATPKDLINMTFNLQKYICPPIAANDCEGMMYEEVAAAFEAAGFTNIEYEIIDDLITGWLTKDGEVENVSLNGNDDFETDDFFDDSASVIISYHTFTIKDETEPEETEPSIIETQAPETEPPVVETQPPETTPVVVEPTIPENSTFSIHFIDVGQADAALVECDGHYMLIDGGNKGDSSLIYTVLKNAKIEKLDIVVATHAHEDHVGGITGAYNYTTADLTLCPVTAFDTDAFGDFKKYADSKGGGITVPSIGDKYTLGNASIDIFGVNSTSDANICSIVLMITYGETKFLFTGDAEREAEQVILDSGVALVADVLKVGHHGSENSTTYPFLREIMPKYAVISVGEDNSYGHPTENTLSRLRDADVKVFRTDMQGDIYCTSDGKTVTMSVEKMPTQIH